ncbi:sigma-70 family RNA polymerase sigma factor [Cytophaga sp. FL35]|uniref:RNA polymerase sigma factor n=1 Tax=Cytophaga sp. FL35 TaxID=1904456 RepID=UPI001653A624|nr:sigma-70 family RNA polymerase sigma factor [Cytophaga sp. FL35]MBC7000561.1 sigma-70 family RNA polymerase sigma factor [Cytophaga sp. FL35]
MPINNQTYKIIVSETEKFIWINLTEGSTDALGQIYDLYAEELFEMALNWTEDRNRIKDGIHDLFLDLYKYRSNISIHDNMKGYLCLSLKRRLFKLKKSKAIFLEKDLNMEKIKVLSEAPYEDLLILSELKSESQSRVLSALNSLTKTQRLSLKLRYEQKHSYEDISDIMNTTVATARTTVYRAMKVLRNQLLLWAVMLIKLFFI